MLFFPIQSNTLYKNHASLPPLQEEVKPTFYKG